MKVGVWREEGWCVWNEDSVCRRGGREKNHILNQIKAMYIVHARAAVNLINNHMYT